MPIWNNEEILEPDTYEVTAERILLIASLRVESLFNTPFLAIVSHFSSCLSDKDSLSSSVSGSYPVVSSL